MTFEQWQNLIDGQILTISKEALRFFPESVRKLVPEFRIKLVSSREILVNQIIDGREVKEPVTIQVCEHEYYDVVETSKSTKCARAERIKSYLGFLEHGEVRTLRLGKMTAVVRKVYPLGVVAKGKKLPAGYFLLKYDGAKDARDKGTRYTTESVAWELARKGFDAPGRSTRKRIQEVRAKVFTPNSEVLKQVKDRGKQRPKTISRVLPG